MTLNCHIPRRNVTIHISNKTRIWEHYAENRHFRKNPNFSLKSKSFGHKSKRKLVENLDHNFDFWPKFDLLTKIWTFDQKFDF